MEQTNEKCRLSICIVVYRDYEEALRAVETIEKFTDTDLNKVMYIIDNSCMDPGDPDRLQFEEDLKRYPDILYIDSGANLGFGRAHNYIIERLDSEYHAIVNPDITIAEDVFSSLIRYMDTDKNIGMCIPAIYGKDGERQRAYRLNPTVFDMFIRMFLKPFFPGRIDKHTMQDMDYSKPFEVPFAQGSFLLIRTGLFREIGGFDEHFFLYMEDADISRRVNETAKLMYYPDASVVHKWGKGSHRRPRLFFCHLRSMCYYFRKWGF